MRLRSEGLNPYLNPGTVSSLLCQWIEPPAPPVWTLDNALEDLSDALAWNQNELQGIPLLRTWTAEQQGEVETYLKNYADQGKQLGMEKISKLLLRDHGNAGHIPSNCWQ
jgi:hypothetical protein